MNEHNLAEDEGDSSSRLDRTNLLFRQLPYTIVLMLAIFGVAYTNIVGRAFAGYWEFLAVAIGVVCVITEWPEVDDRQVRLRLIWTQALHWATFLVLMNIMLLPGVQSMLPAPASSLVFLMLLALGTFLAGINLLSLPIIFLGLAMALLVPVIAWFKQSALFLILAAILLVGFGLTFWPRRSKKQLVQTLKG